VIDSIFAHARRTHEAGGKPVVLACTYDSAIPEGTEGHAALRWSPAVVLMTLWPAPAPDAADANASHGFRSQQVQIPRTSVIWLTANREGFTIAQLYQVIRDARFEDATYE
jgi:hypothetical protein